MPPFQSYSAELPTTRARLPPYSLNVWTRDKLAANQRTFSDDCITLPCTGNHAAWRRWDGLVSVISERTAPASKRSRGRVPRVPDPDVGITSQFLERSKSTVRPPKKPVAPVTRTRLARTVVTLKFAILYCTYSW